VTTWRANVLGTVRVLEAVSAAQVPAVVCASSVGGVLTGTEGCRGRRVLADARLADGRLHAGKAYVERVLDGFEREHPGCRVVRLRPGFIFRRETAAEQGRLFGGPLLPYGLVRPGRVPLVPDIPDLRFQAVHSADAAEAYRLAVTRPVHGAFNIAAGPVIDARRLGEVLRATPVRVPATAVRGLLAAAWHLHLVPASPQLFDAVLRIPIMDTTRARTELGWSPQYDSLQALHEFFDGLGEGTGKETPPLAVHAGGRARLKEFLTGVGQRS
jgi:UDP-glucose 4-epimerase